MTRHFQTVAALAALALPTVVAIGCTSENKAEAPYSLTGSAQASSSEDFAARHRYTDDKGRYRPELAAQNIPQH
jgi:hypothetical protein